MRRNAFVDRLDASRSMMRHGASVSWGYAYPHTGLGAGQMTERHYRWEQPRIDRQGIALLLITAILALVLTTAVLWVGLR
jgi:hypothetical protein